MANLTGPELAIVKAIVSLNFNHPEEALDILIRALSDINFQPERTISHGNRAQLSA
jgi:hypothetical protein